MHAEAGNELTVRGQGQGHQERRGEIIEVQGEDGKPPYLVRWEDGSESVVFLSYRMGSSRSRPVSRIREAGEERRAP